MGEYERRRGCTCSVQSSEDAEATQNYAYLVARRDVYRQRGDTYHALSAFAQANEIDPEDPRPAMPSSSYRRRRGGNSTECRGWIGVSRCPIFEDENIYQLDARLRGFQNGGALLPPPRHSIETFADARYHLHIGNLPTISGLLESAMRTERSRFRVSS